MADWRKLSKAILLADGKIDDREVAVLRKRLAPGGNLDEAGLEYLLELRGAAQGVAVAFNQLLFDGMKRYLLADGNLSTYKASWLRRWLFADGKIDFAEEALAAGTQGRRPPDEPGLRGPVQAVHGDLTVSVSRSLARNGNRNRSAPAAAAPHLLLGERVDRPFRLGLRLCLEDRLGQI